MTTRPSTRRLLLAVAAVCLAVVAISGTQLSGATYTAGSTHTVAVSAANDWTPPTVAVTNPGTLVSGTTTIAATASDARGTVTSVVLQHAPAGTGTWTTLCTDTTSPYSCSWTTTSVPDAAYDLRAIATDDAGLTATSAVVTTRVANNASVVLADPDPVVRGTVSLSAAVAALPGGAKFAFSYAPTGTTSWTTICAQTSTFTTSATCSWNTAALTAEYDVRVVATSTAGTTYTDVSPVVIVDNTAPTASLAVPGAPLRGTVTLTATADDLDSGMDSVTFQFRRQGTTTWTTCGTATIDPYSCQFASASVVDGTYEFQAIAADVAGNLTTTPVQTRAVDNTVSSVSVTSPTAGATVRGDAVTLTAAANSNRGITSVRLEVKPSAGSTWSPVCTATTAPYTCTWNTTAVTTDSYDVRAVLLDGSGGTTTSAVVTVKVDNTLLRAFDVQALNGGIIARPDQRDQLVLTYSTVVSTTSVKAGWDGSATTVAPTFYDRQAQGTASTTRDNVVLTGTNLGSVSFAQNFVGKRKTASFAGSTMVASVQTVGGTPVTVITITLGTTTGTLSTRNTAGAMIWTPTSQVQTPSGQASSTATATESGTTDTDF